MNSLLLRTSAKIIAPLQIVLSIILLLRGHNEPGGGFVGGLVFASAFIFYGVAYGMPASRHLLRFDPRTILGVGLIAATASGLLAPILGLPFLTGVWSNLSIQSFVAGQIKLGTPLLFDVGVFLVVVGTATLMVYSMSEEES